MSTPPPTAHEIEIRSITNLPGVVPESSVVLLCECGWFHDTGKHWITLSELHVAQIAHEHTSGAGCGSPQP